MPYASLNNLLVGTAIELNENGESGESSEKELKILNETRANNGRILKGSSALLKGLELYHLFGFLSLVFSALCLARKPRWVGLLSLPIGLFGGFLAIIAM